MQLDLDRLFRSLLVLRTNSSVVLIFQSGGACSNHAEAGNMQVRPGYK